MNNETYNKLQKLSTILRNRFSELRSVTQGMYKVYDADLKFFDQTMIEVLTEFEDVSLRALYTQEVLNELPSQSEWFTNPMFKRGNNELFISHDLEIAIYYFLVSTFSKSIAEFLDLLNRLQVNYDAFTHWDNDRTKLTINRSAQEIMFNQLKVLKNSNYVWHLFTQVSAGIIYAPNEYNVVIETERIAKVMKTAQDYTFEILRQKFVLADNG